MTQEKQFVLGAMYLGTRLDQRASFAILDHLAELGGGWIDTSNNYSFWEDPSGFGGQSEDVVGAWLRANPGAPVRLSTKVGAQPTHPGGFPDHLEGLRRETVRHSLEVSLKRLDRERIDLFWAHVEDDAVSMTELVSTFGELVTEGSVASYGLSNHPSWRVAQARAKADELGVARPTGYQQRYSYLQPSPGAPVTGQPIPLGMLSSDGRELLRRTPEMTGWVYTSLLLGAYDRADRTLPSEYQYPGNDRRLAALKDVASGRGLQQGQIVLAWLTGGDPALTPIVGVSSPEQLTQAWIGVHTELEPDERQLLDSAF